MNELLGFLFGIVSMLGFGIQDAFMIKAARTFGGFRTSFYIILVVTLIMVPLGFFLFSFSGITLAILLGLLAAAVLSATALFSFNKGFHVGNPSIVATVASASGAVTAILSLIFFNQQLTAIQITAVALIVLGTILVSFKSGKLHLAKGHLGVGYAIIAMIGWGGFFFIISWAVQSVGWFTAGLLVEAMTVVVYLIYSTVTKTQVFIESKHYPYLVMLGVLNMIAFLSYNLGVTYGYTFVVAPVSAAAQVIVILFSLLVLKEGLSGNQKLGVLLALVGLIVIAL